jgi:hypothetical protein
LMVFLGFFFSFFKWLLSPPRMDGIAAHLQVWIALYGVSWVSRASEQCLGPAPDSPGQASAPSLALELLTEPGVPAPQNAVPGAQVQPGTVLLESVSGVRAVQELLSVKTRCGPIGAARRGATSCHPASSDRREWTPTPAGTPS